MRDREFEPLRKSNLKTARAWAIKETLMDFFRYRQVKRAKDFFDDWCKWPITNAASEALNSKIQWIKYTARGFRSREGYRRAIYFHCGGLSLYPQGM